MTVQVRYDFNQWIHNTNLDNVYDLKLLDTHARCRSKKIGYREISNILCYFDGKSSICDPNIPGCLKTPQYLLFVCDHNQNRFHNRSLPHVIERMNQYHTNAIELEIKSIDQKVLYISEVSAPSPRAYYGQKN